MLEGLSQLLSALGAAEGAYASAMAAAAQRVRQAVAAGLDADDGEVRAAGEALMRLPSVVELAHRWGRDGAGRGGKGGRTRRGLIGGEAPYGAFVTCLDKGAGRMQSILRVPHGKHDPEVWASY